MLLNGTSNMTKSNVMITRKNHLCCGCGVCATICPVDAITISFDKNKEYKPFVEHDKCISCGLCLKACPMAVDNLVDRIEHALCERSDYGLSNVQAIIKGYDTDDSHYRDSSSGGILSCILKYLLENDYIDAVIHAEPCYGHDTTPFFKASVSNRAEEIDRKRSSFYYPIEFSDVLRKIKSDAAIQKVAFVGVPCAVSGIHYLKQNDQTFARKITFSFSLICSHSVSGQFADCIEHSLDTSPKGKFLNFRDKIDIDNAGNFNNSLSFPEGTSIRKSRFLTPFTVQWRSYSYALNACLFCPDFFGVHAHAGFKDAWGFSLVRKTGETVCFINSNVLAQNFLKMKNDRLLQFFPVDLDTFKASQKATVDFKMNNIDFRVVRSALLYKKLKNKLQHTRGSHIEQLAHCIDFYLKKITMLYTKALRRYFNIKESRFIVRGIYFISLRLLKKIEHMNRLRNVYLKELWLKK